VRIYHQLQRGRVVARPLSYPRRDSSFSPDVNADCNLSSCRFHDRSRRLDYTGTVSSRRPFLPTEPKSLAEPDLPSSVTVRRSFAIAHSSILLAREASLVSRPDSDLAVGPG
jgi:hypothetical protein